MTTTKRWRVPAVDVLESESAWRLVADVPQADKEALDLTVHEGVIRIRAAIGEGGGYERSFRLPQGVDGGAVQAALADGVLTLTIPKPAEARPQRIAIA